MLNPLGAQAEAHDRKTVLRHGGALAREAESEGGRRPECRGKRLAHATLFRFIYDQHKVAAVMR